MHETMHIISMYVGRKSKICSKALSVRCSLAESSLHSKPRRRKRTRPTKDEPGVEVVGVVDGDEGGSQRRLRTRPMNLNMSLKFLMIMPWMLMGPVHHHLRGQ